jgi:alpha-1,6-mannosyltransferase
VTGGTPTPADTDLAPTCAVTGIWDDKQVVATQRSETSPQASLVPSHAAWMLRTHWDYKQLSLAGLVATVLIALGSFGAGALPANDPTKHIPVIGMLRHGTAGLHVSLALYYGGLILLMICWLLLGRLLLTGSTNGLRPVNHEVINPSALRTTLIRWMLPLLFGMPLASMDLYSYSAQAQLARLGRDPYTFTPADLPGKFLDNVAWKWVDTPSPYGPLWVTVSRRVAGLTSDHALLSVLVLRLIPFIAIVITAWLIPGLAQRFGHRGDLALWLGIANPLVLVHGVGGGHNDAAMVALLVGGLAIALRPRATWVHLALGAMLMALAAAVKAPGAVGVAFIVPIYLSGRPTTRLRDWCQAILIAAAVAVVVFGAITWMVGYGNGWTKQLSPDAPVVTLMSLPTALALLYRVLTGNSHPLGLVDGTVRSFRRAGTIGTAVLLTALWFRSTRGNAVQLLAVAMLAVVLLSPSVQPWYFTWALTIAALFVTRPSQVAWIAVASLSLTLLTQPMGSGLGAVPLVLAVILSGVAARCLLGPVVSKPKPEQEQLATATG